MKVECLLTIRCTPESRGEMIDRFAAVYRDFRAQIEDGIAKELPIQIPHTSQVRWILESGRWDNEHA